jgi:chromatin structure-remodeling complex protein RSC7
MPDVDAGAGANTADEKDEDVDENEAREEESGDDGEGADNDDDGGEGDEEEEHDESEASAKEPTPPPQPVIRRKRLGRPPKNRPPDWDNMVTVTKEEADTPRRRGRGGWRGRGGRKGGPAAPKMEQVIDAEGTVADIVDDECVLPEDPEGETKVDKMGNLKGGREYRCRTFKVLGRGNRLYMLSTEPARCVGFRDSYLFFTKHRKLYKIIVDDEEKRDMIERDIIPHSYKGRSIGIVTARSVFREFGARIVVGGKRIIDDYAVAQARAEGAVEGELADPEDRYVVGEPYNKNQYVAWHGASSVYHTNAPSAPVPTGKVESKKRKVNVNDTNWMLEHAREARYVKGHLMHHGSKREKERKEKREANVGLQCFQRGHQCYQEAEQCRRLRHSHKHHAVSGRDAANTRAHRASGATGRRGHQRRSQVPPGSSQDGQELLRHGHVL